MNKRKYFLFLVAFLSLTLINLPSHQIFASKRVVHKSEPSAAPSPRYYVLPDGRDQIIIKVNNEETITKLEEIINTGKPKVVGGTFRSGSQSYEPRYSWYWEPDSVWVSDISVELCDTGIRALQDDGWLEGQQACFWNAGVPVYSSTSPPVLADLVAPQTYISSGPEGIILSNSFRFDFYGTDNIDSQLLFSPLLLGKDGSRRGSKYDFYEATSAEYRNINDGSYNFTVRAKDDTFWVDNTPAARNIIVDTASPSISIISPASGLVSGKVPINVQASDSGSGVKKVEFKIDGVTKANDFSAPYGFEWNATQETAENHLIETIAYDNAGRTQTASVNVYVKASIIYPIVYDVSLNPQYLSGVTTLKASTYSNFQTKALQVSFFATTTLGQKTYLGEAIKENDNLWRFHWNTFLLPDGMYKVAVKVLFSDSLYESAPVQYMLKNSNK